MQQEALNVNQQRLQDHILQLETNLCNERELNSAAKKEVFVSPLSFVLFGWPGLVVLTCLCWLV